MKGFTPTAESNGFSAVPTFCGRDCGRDYGRDVVLHRRNGKERGSGLDHDFPAHFPSSAFHLAKLCR